MNAHVRIHNGTPTLFLDDQPVYANIHWVGLVGPEGLEANQASMRAFSETGVHIYSTDGLVHDWCGPRAGQPLPYDFSALAARLQMGIEADPDALFLLRIMFETRYLVADWWHQQYPDELELLSDGSRPSASYASLEWQAQVQAVLRALVEHLRSVGLYDRVIAYQICTGTCGEWIKAWSSMGPVSGDFSTPMRQQFRAWLRRRYAGDPAALQMAWADPQITFETADVPSQQEQDQTTHYLFRDPRQEQKTIDFYACYADITADALLAMCHTVKLATQGEKLTGAFFGYLMELAWNDSFFTDGWGDQAASEVSTVQRSGHLGLQKLLRSPDIDFLVSPYGYAFRGLGGDGLPMPPTESLRRHGKLYLFEEDTLMHNSYDPGGRMHPVDRSLAIYQRNFAQVVTHGLGITWLENHQFPEDPSILPKARRLHRRFQAIGTWALGLDRAPQAEVAVFLDDESYLYEGNRNHIDLPLIWHQRAMTFNRFGAPHDVYLLNDLLEGGLPPYKLYIFLNVFHLDNRRREALQSIIRRDGRVALWFYAPGYINTDARDAALHTDWMTQLTGIRFGLGRSYWAPMMHVTDFTHPITRGLPQDLFWGTTRNIAPIFHVDDPEAEVLGEVIHALGRCRPGLAVKTFGSKTPDQAWTSVYVATPTVPAAVLRGIARYAGVHLYNEAGDVLYATPELLSVHTVAGGPRTFRLPRPVEVIYDLFNDCPVGQAAAHFDVELPPASTALYYTGQADRLRALTSLR